MSVTQSSVLPAARFSTNGHHSPRDASEHFKLTPEFLRGFQGRKPNFGFNGLGEFVFYRTYSRNMVDGRKETFLDTLQRVVEGCYEIQRQHCYSIQVPWDYDKAQESAQEMFQLMWDFKFLPPGRGLWMMGTKFMWERGSAALNNCAFYSTKDIDTEPAEPFCFLMDMSMLGVGVGFDTEGANKLEISHPGFGTILHEVGDSREGWVDSLRALVKSYTTNTGKGEIEFDYSPVRPANSDIKGFGGKASGPGILMLLHDEFRRLFDKRIGRKLSSVDITDGMNLIGKCIVAGNVRRTAEIAFGKSNDQAYFTMKNATAGLLPDELGHWHFITGKLYAQNRITATVEDFSPGAVEIPLERLLPAIETWNSMNNHRWASNNSVITEIGEDYSDIAQSIAVNGEPGVMWLQTMKDYGRMKDGENAGIDGGVMGSNPCLEQSLESGELCCLVETFPANHDTFKDYWRTLKFAYLYAKTVTLLPTHNRRTNSVMQRNRRIGLSQSGIVQAFAKFGRRDVLNNFCDAGFKEVKRWDETYSKWLCVTRSIKVTSVKPSGTVSLMVGATPGIHYPEATTYWRRVRISKESALLKGVIDAGYHVEPSINDPERTMVVKFAIDDQRVPSVDKVSMWHQLANVADYQYYWADNQVSCTIKFKPEERAEICPALEAYEDKLKGICFLPWSNHGYAQAPYEPCTSQEVADYNAGLKELDFTGFINEDASGSKFCDGDSCEI